MLYCIVCLLTKINDWKFVIWKLCFIKKIGGKIHVVALYAGTKPFRILELCVRNSIICVDF